MSLSTLLVLGVNAGTLHDLPTRSALGELSQAQKYRAVRDAGLTMMQRGDDALATARGLDVAGIGRVVFPSDIAPLVADSTSCGHRSLTLHVGTGFKTNDRVDELVQAVLECQKRFEIPLLIETHRATITQDPFRTLQLVDRFPDLRFTADFSHWYTGLEMTYGDIKAKFDALQPVFDRVRAIHGRIGDPGCMQIDIGRGDAAEHPSIEHFREMWERSFLGFLTTREDTEQICFLPELLSPENYYARRGDSGDEAGDRWLQALVLIEIAKSAFDAAARQFEATSHSDA